MPSFPYPPGQPSGEWIVTLPGGASIGEVIVYAAPVVTPGTYEEQVLADDPLYWWKMTEDSGTTLVESIEGVDMTLTGTYALADDVAPTGNAVFFDGGSGRALSATDMDLSAWDVITVECWVRWLAFTNPASDEHILFSLENSGGDEGLRVHFDGPAAYYSGKHRVQVGPTNAFNRIFNFPAITADEWTHVVIVATRDSTPIGKAYVNGAAETITVEFSSSDSAPFSGTLAMLVGYLSGVAGSADYWINQLAVYGGELTAGRILAHYEAATS